MQRPNPSAVFLAHIGLSVALLTIAVSPHPVKAETSALGAINLLPNGDFEQGPAVWTQSSTHGFDLIRHLSEVGVNARSGIWGAVMGLVDSETAYIEQQVQVPTGAPTINYWYQLNSVDTHRGFDFARIIVNGSDVIDEFHLHDDENTVVWTLRTADISAYEGQTVVIRILAKIDIAETSTILIDDVFFDFEAVPAEIFDDGFESGDTSAWSRAVP